MKRQARNRWQFIVTLVRSACAAPIAALLISLLTGAFSAQAAEQDPAASSAARYYLIGNSLTWDTVPSRLDGDTQWHVDCGVSLPTIYARPENPCVKASTVWPTALRDKQYDVVAVQPHYGATLEQDVETISAWMAMQPNAAFVIHSGWARQAERAAEFASFAAPQEMEHSPLYVRALIAELRRRHPQRELRQTLAQNLLAQIAEDIAAGKTPLESLETLYRDKIHLTLDHGRYLMHNAMRRALGQPPSNDGFERLDPSLKAYLDGVLALLHTSPTDQALLRRILAVDEVPAGRQALTATISDETLRQRLTRLLPTIELAAASRRETLALQADIEAVGGKLLCAPSGPQWLYLATGDSGVELFDVPAAIDLYNGNNPLKGRGGRNQRVTDAWLKRLSRVATLRRLDLANCAIEGSGLQHISGLTGLREINLTLTPVTDDALKHLAGLTELRKLGLASTRCTGAGFAHLQALRKLESVNFHFTPLNDAGLAAVARLPISDRLWFAHTHFTDAGAAALSGLTRLKRCGIGSAEKTSSGEAVASLVGLPLEDLALLDNQATPAGVAHAAKIASLRRLDISYAPTVTDDSMRLVARMPKLEELKIGGAPLTDEGLLLLADSGSLKRLTLSGLKSVTPAGLDQLRRARPKLVIEVQAN